MRRRAAEMRRVGYAAAHGYSSTSLCARAKSSEWRLSRAIEQMCTWGEGEARRTQGVRAAYSKAKNGAIEQRVGVRVEASAWPLTREQTVTLMC
eukprot:6182286-Pleurochrysis_carterae.AAC.2